MKNKKLVKFSLVPVKADESKYKNLYPMNTGDGKSRSIEVAECENLRFAPGLSLLEPTGVPLKWLGDVARPFYFFYSGNDEIALMWIGGNVCYSILSEETALVRKIFATDEQPSGVIDLGKGRLQIAVDDSYYLLDFNNLDVTVQKLDFAEITFSVEQNSRLTKNIDSMKLSGNYSSDDVALSETDAKNYSKNLREAYCRLVDVVNKTGLLMQPVYLRYKLLDANGTQLFCSVPKLISSLFGYQCCDYYSVALTDDYLTVPRALLNVYVARVFAKIPSFYGTPVAKIVFEVTDPLHPVDFDMVAETALTRSGNDKYLKFYMPGTSVSLLPDLESRKQKEKRLQHSGNEAFHVIAVYDASTVDEIQLRLTVGRGADVQLSAQKKLLAAVDDTKPTWEERLKKFTAKVGLRIGKWLLYGDIRCNDGENHEDCVMLVKASEPNTFGELVDARVGRVVAMREMLRRDSSLDSSRCRVYIFGTRGVAVLTIRDNGTIAGVNRIDSRGITSADAIVDVAGRDYQIVAALDGDLVTFNRMKVNDIANRLKEINTVAFSAATGELFATDNSGKTILIDKTLQYFSTISPFKAEAVCGNLIPTFYNDGCFYRLAPAPENDDSANCRIVVDLTAPEGENVSHRPMSLRLLTLEAAGEAEGKLTVNCSNLPSKDGFREEYVQNASVYGRFNAPISIRIIAPERRYLRLTIDLAAKESLKLGRAELTFSGDSILSAPMWQPERRPI